MSVTTVLALALLTHGASDAPAPVRDGTNAAVAKGLKWLAEQQKADGHWSGQNDLYPTFVTGYAGAALLMEGSTLKQGTYAPNLRKALAWMERNAQPSGSLGGKHQTEPDWQLHGHASALTFLVCVYDVDDDEARRERVAKLIQKAIAFATEAQTESGGWHYTNTDKRYDDSYATTAVLHALFAARKSGFEVPKSTTERAVRYLVKATNRTGEVRYCVLTSEGAGAPAPDPTLAAAAAIGLMLSEDPRPDALPRWVKSARADASPVMQNLATNPVALSQQYYMGRVAFGLGENGHRRIDPTASAGELGTWSAYKRAAFKTLVEAQDNDGSWADVFFGRARMTAVVLIVLQLDNGYLPAFSR
jgi:hypothetical protein